VPTGSDTFLKESMLGSDSALPAQLCGARRGSASMEPLKNLMTAVLADAIRCYQRNFQAVTLHKKCEFEEARNWLFKDRNDGPFSFDTVCYVLETDPDLLRRQLIQFRYAPNRECGRGRMTRLR
jgi:hypothetical protein